MGGALIRKDQSLVCRLPLMLKSSPLLTPWSFVEEAFLLKVFVEAKVPVAMLGFPPVD